MDEVAPNENAGAAAVPPPAADTALVAAGAAAPKVKGAGSADLLEAGAAAEEPNVNAAAGAAAAAGADAEGFSGAALDALPAPELPKVNVDLVAGADGALADALAGDELTMGSLGASGDPNEPNVNLGAGEADPSAGADPAAPLPNENAGAGAARFEDLLGGSSVDSEVDAGAEDLLPKEKAGAAVLVAEEAAGAPLPKENAGLLAAGPGADASPGRALSCEEASTADDDVKSKRTPREADCAPATPSFFRMLCGVAAEAPDVALEEAEAAAGANENAGALAAEPEAFAVLGVAKLNAGAGLPAAGAPVSGAAIVEALPADARGTSHASQSVRFSSFHTMQDLHCHLPLLRSRNTSSGDFLADDEGVLEPLPESSVALLPPPGVVAALAVALEPGWANVEADAGRGTSHAEHASALLLFHTRHDSHFHFPLFLARNRAMSLLPPGGGCGVVAASWLATTPTWPDWVEAGCACRGSPHETHVSRAWTFFSEHCVHVHNCLPSLSLASAEELGLSLGWGFGWGLDVDSGSVFEATDDDASDKELSENPRLRGAVSRSSPNRKLFSAAAELAAWAAARGTLGGGEKAKVGVTGEGTGSRERPPADAPGADGGAGVMGEMGPACEASSFFCLPETSGVASALVALGGDGLGVPALLVVMRDDEDEDEDEAGGLATAAADTEFDDERADDGMGTLSALMRGGTAAPADRACARMSMRPV